jgi:hypothetical protein
LLVGNGGDTAIAVDLDEATYPNGVVTLRNLNISGLYESNSGSDGIRVIGGGAAVHIETARSTASPSRGSILRRLRPSTSS